MDELMKKLRSLRAKLEEINVRAKDGVLDEGDQRSFDETLADIERTKAAIDRQKAIDAERAADDAERRAIEAAAGGPAAATPPTVTDVRDLDAEKPFRTLGEQLQAIRAAEVQGAAPDKRLLHLNRAASGAAAGIPSDGGYLIQTDLAAGILKVMHDASAIMSRTRQIPISANADSIEIPAVDETSRATGSRWGGVRVYWASEADTVTASKPKLRKMSLKLNKLMGLYYATEELLRDAGAMGAIVEQAFGEEMAFVADDAILRGDGAGKPLGVLNSNCLVSVAAEGSQSADTILYANVVKMWSRMWARSRQSAVWFINQDCEPQLYQMSMTIGSGGVPVYMPANGISGQPYATLFGRPVIPIEHADTVGDLGDILLADFSQYITITKGGVSGQQSIHVRFIYDETAFKWTYRLDGQPLWNSALTPYQSTNTLSPFVGLAAR